MNIFSNRTILMINTCALFVAFVTAAETVSIQRRLFGVAHPGGVWPVFVPVIVMLIINRRAFSWSFLILYFALSLQLAYEIWYPVHYTKGIENWQTLFFLISLVCLFLYPAGIIIRAIINAADRKMDK
jgi:hypothetical protein